MRSAARSGLTLIEIMIALTITLVVLFAMAQAFQYASNQIADGRAVLEMANRLRNAQQLMRIDLANRTVQDVRPYTDRAPKGYFEYIDGNRTDTDNVGGPDGYKGDTDDVIAMTCRRVNGNYRGRITDYTQSASSRHTVESQFAEIIWFTEYDDRNGDGEINFDESLSLYRRVLLISPDRNREINPPGFGGVGGPQQSVMGVLWTGNELPANNGGGDINSDPAFRMAVDFFVNNDLSARWIDSDGDANGARDLIVANSLDDLAKRENRYGRDSRIGFYPHPMVLAGVSLTRMGAMDGTDIVYSGDDILLTDVAAFDIRIFSAEGEVELVDVDANGINETMLTATDTGYAALPAAMVETSLSGAYVDLGKVGGAFDLGEPKFTTLPADKSQLDVANPPTYCTWSPHYERDGIDQDNDGDFDLGTNGIDDDGFNGVDDQEEWESAPPYPYRARGVQVVFRIVEKDSRQIRQATVVQNFIQ